GAGEPHVPAQRVGGGRESGGQRRGAVRGGAPVVAGPHEHTRQTEQGVVRVVHGPVGGVGDRDRAGLGRVRKSLVGHRVRQRAEQPVGDGDGHLVITCTVRSCSTPGVTTSTPTVTPCPSGTTQVGSTVTSRWDRSRRITSRSVCVSVSRSTV